MATTLFQCYIINVRNISPTVFELLFQPDKPIPFRAGQYLSVIVPARPPSTKDLRRAYSIASSPEEPMGRLCIKWVEEGPGSNYLCTLKRGQYFRAYAPYGQMIYRTAPQRRCCFVATGTGISPFLSMVGSREYMENRPLQTRILMGVRNHRELLYEDLVSTVPGSLWTPCITQPTANYHGFIGRVTDWLSSQGSEFPWSETDFYICGGSTMIDETKQILLQRGVSREAIFQEIYYQ